MSNRMQNILNGLLGLTDRPELLTQSSPVSAGMIKPSNMDLARLNNSISQPQRMVGDISQTMDGAQMPNYQTMSALRTPPLGGGALFTDEIGALRPSYGSDQPVTPREGVDLSSAPVNMENQQGEGEQGILDRMTGAISDFVYPDGDVNWGLVAGLNAMTLNPDAGIQTMAAQGMKAARSRSNVNKTIALLRQKALDPSVDEKTRQKIFHNLDMMSSNPDLADELQRDTLSLITGQTDPSDIKVYEPRVEQGTGQVYIPVVNKATGNVEKKYLNVTELTEKEKIKLKIDEELIGKDKENKEKAYNDTFIKAQNVGNNIRSLEQLLGELDQGATTGFIAKWFPTVRSQTAMFEQIANQLGLDIVGSVTFGALSERELALAMDTAVPSGLAPAEMRKWAEKRIAARMKLQQELLRRVDALGKATSYKDFLQSEADLQQRHINASWWGLDKKEQGALVGAGINYEQWANYNLNDREEALRQLRK